MNIQWASSSSSSFPVDNDDDEDVWLDLQWKGVTVSQQGFLVLFQTSMVTTTTTTTTLPIRISSSDLSSAKSIEALTTLQLINGIDMAGTCFPPNILSSLSALWCSSTDTTKIRMDESTSAATEEEEEEEYAAAKQILQQTISSQLGDTILYEEATMWQRNQIKFPPITLLRVRLSLPPLPPSSLSLSITNNSSSSSSKVPTNIIFQNFVPFQFHLECKLQPSSSSSTLPFTIPVFSEPLAVLPKNEGVSSLETMQDTSATTTTTSSNCYSIPLEDLDMYGIIHPETSAAFLSLALALRYRVPVGIYKTDMIQLLRQRTTNNLSSEELVLPTTDNEDDDQALQTYFPNWQSIHSLHTINDRVTTTFATNFEQSRLEMALKVALDRGDEVAAEKIRKSISILLSQQQQQRQYENPTMSVTATDSFDKEEGKKSSSRNTNNINDDDDDDFSFQ